MQFKELESKIEELYFHEKLEKVYELLKENISVIDFEDDDDDTLTPLFNIAERAAKKRDTPTLNLLVDSGMDINIRNPYDGYTLLMTLCKTKWAKKESLELVISLGVDKDIKNKYGQTAVDIAAENEAEEACAFFSSQISEDDLYQMDSTGKTVFHRACESGLTDSVASLLDKGFDVDYPYDANENRISLRLDYSGKSALQIACLFSVDNIVNLLLERGANINFTDQNGNTPLHYCTDMSQMLNSSQSFPAIERLTQERIGIIKSLINKEANTNAVNDRGETPLLKCIREGSNETEEISLLLIPLTDVNKADLEGYTPLHRILDNDNMNAIASKEVCKALLEKGADINAVNKYGRSALILACKNDQDSIAKLLIRKGADVNITDNNGESAIDIVAKKGNPELMEKLLGA